MPWWNSSEYCHVTPKIDHHHTNYFKWGDYDVHNVAWVITGFLTALACILSLIQIYRHCANYTNPSQQKHIIRIMLMVPIYAIDSFLSFRFYWLSVYFDVVRDCYEAFVIYTFYSLLIEWVGGYRDGKEIFAKKDPFKLAIPLCCITVAPKRGLLRQCKRLTLQYAIIRPITTILALILHSADQYCPGNFAPIHGYFYISIVNFISVTVAMYALVQFYSVSKHEIAKYKPIPKFLSVKFVIFLSFWQAICVGLFVNIHGIKETTYWTTENISTGVQNALLCVEMFIAAIWHYKAFEYRDFQTGDKTPVLKSAADSFNPYDIAQDVYYSFYPKKQLSHLKDNIHKHLIKKSDKLFKRDAGRNSVSFVSVSTDPNNNEDEETEGGDHSYETINEKGSVSNV